MSKAYSAIRDDIETLLQDAGIDPSPAAANSIFATAELDVLIPNALIYLSQHAYPWEYKLTKTTTDSSRDITLTTGDKWRLLGIKKLEYIVDQDPREFRNHSKFGDVVTIKCDRLPAGEDIYLFMNKIHLLSTAIGATDASGALNAGAAAGATSLVLKSVGTGTVEEQTTLMITGDTTVYYVTEQATISTTVTVKIWPPLAAAALEDAVVTLSLSSTLDTKLEDWLERYVAARAAISKATKSYAQVNTAITTIANAATAILAIAAIIAKAETATTGDIALGRADAVLGAAAIVLANAEFDKIVVANTGQLDLAKTALASGAALINTIPVGGGAPEYMGQAASDVGLAQGFIMAGQSYLQEASADHANAAQYFNAAALELRTASEKAQEANANLSLVATRLRVSEGGRHYEAWGRQELAKVEQELHALNGYNHSVRYAED